MGSMNCIRQSSYLLEAAHIAADAICAASESSFDK